ncbi:MAG: hypothetical protein NTY74_04100 [Ignavibacteriae bacterium]|nr:hypothetical protein [Ignavibacteriota bacterium]
MPEVLKTSRIWQHINSNNTFAVISAFRIRGRENEEKHQGLKEQVRSLGLGFTELKGGFTKEEKLVQAKALVIANIGKKDILMLAEKFKQERFLFKNKKMFVEYGKNDIEGIWETLKIFENDGEQSKFEFTKDLLKYYYGNLLGAFIGFKNIFIKEIEPTGFNRVAYNSHIPLRELNLDDIK